MKEKKREGKKEKRRRKSSRFINAYIGLNTIEVACSAGDKIEKRVGTKVFESGNRKRTCKWNYKFYYTRPIKVGTKHVLADVAEK